MSENTGNVVRVSDITAEGFWVHVCEKVYHITRERYPWFRAATDEEIYDVSFSSVIDGHHQNMLFWHTLGIDFDSESIEHPELIYHVNRVRCVPRPDLFADIKAKAQKHSESKCRKIREDNT